VDVKPARTVGLVDIVGKPFNEASYNKHLAIKIPDGVDPKEFAQKYSRGKGQVTLDDDVNSPSGYCVTIHFSDRTG
jgi:hypothetical protein